MKICEEPADVAWPVLIYNWSICDGLYTNRGPYLDLMRHLKHQWPPISFYNADDQHFWNALPDIVTVFRGCGRRQVRGLSWTTNREIAAFFAKGGRFRPPYAPSIACATVSKSDIFFIKTSRKEAEIVLDPYKISRPSLKPL